MHDDANSSTTSSHEWMWAGGCEHTENLQHQPLMITLSIAKAQPYEPCGGRKDESAGDHLQRKLKLRLHRLLSKNLIGDMPRKYDIVVFGGSGVTGQRVIAEVASAAGPEKRTFAVAGRSEQKLRAVLHRLGVNVDVSNSLEDARFGRRSRAHRDCHTLTSLPCLAR